jgi:hypothetical protein
VPSSVLVNEGIDVHPGEQERLSLLLDQLLACVWASSSVLSVSDGGEFADGPTCVGCAVQAVDSSAPRALGPARVNGRRGYGRPSASDDQGIQVAHIHQRTAQTLALRARLCWRIVRGRGATSGTSPAFTVSRNDQNDKPR